jgi:hypothetical protein
VKLFLVGKFVAETAEDMAWEFHGIYDSEERAVAACFDWRFSVCPVTLNETAPDVTYEFPGSYYPHTRPAEMPTEGGI